MLALRRGVNLGEALEYRRALLRCQPGTGIDDVEPDAIIPDRLEFDIDAARIGEFDGVSDQIDQDLAHTLLIAVHIVGQRFRNLDGKFQALAAGNALDGIEADDVPDVNTVLEPELIVRNSTRRTK